eukprot:7194998-Prymnesium_polylepis.4
MGRMPQEAGHVTMVQPVPRRHRIWRGRTRNGVRAASPEVRKSAADCGDTSPPPFCRSSRALVRYITVGGAVDVGAGEPDQWI